MVEPSPRLPLEAHEVLRASSAQAYAAWCEKRRVPLALRPLRARGGFEVRIFRRSLPGGCLEVARNGGSDLRVEGAEDESRYQLILPVTGRGRLHLGSTDIGLKGYVAGALLGPGRPHSLILSSCWADLSVYVDRESLLTSLQEWSGDDGCPFPAFAPAVSLKCASAARLRALTASLFREAEDGSREERLAELLERWRLALLRSLPGDHQPHMVADDPLVHRRHVRAAEEYMEANLTRPLRMTAVAREVGVGLRALQKSFLAYRARRPVAVLNALRLERARARLMQGTGLSVREAAERSGLGHMGRFSIEYRRAFGEAPSETRRRARSVPFCCSTALDLAYQASAAP